MMSRILHICRFLRPDLETLIVFQSFGGALIVAAGQSIFQNKLVDTLSGPNHCSGCDPVLVIAAGAQNLRENFSDAQLEGILAAYMKGIRPAFALAVAAAGVAFIIALSQPWFRLNKPAKT